MAPWPPGPPAPPPVSDAYVVDNILVQVGIIIFRQSSGIDCAPLLYSHIYISFTMNIDANLVPRLSCVHT